MTPADRREQLLDAVLRVIATRGVGKVSIDAVAKEAGVTRPVVYKLFDDSNALLRASLVREERRATEQYLAAFPSAAAGRALPELVAELYAGLLLTFERSPDLWRAVFELSDSTTTVFRARLERGRAAAAGRIERMLTEHPDADVEDPSLAARMVFAVIVESGRLLLAEDDRYPRERLIASADRIAALVGGTTPA
ncbi:hypothetical protein AXK60_14575 [Tsukamurella pseudospumae]|uniref:HTH tetR-type domain-containing protein n=2 Tax=Tsukamurella pseudospumae TaxID=239498 RepID=A0A137ZY42_9ACTN|nr:hypothetical protein AXK61_19520 [Tsukamurella pseudospumae]KXP03092.1 hypothetical protein AXK60_14575 [Tsukamurella pseudospumae]